MGYTQSRCQVTGHKAKTEERAKFVPVSDAPLFSALSRFNTSALLRSKFFIMNTYALLGPQALCNEHLRISGGGGEGVGVRSQSRIAGS
jgi:hypothetical protein